MAGNTPLYWLVKTALAVCLLIGALGELNPVLAAKRIELYDAEGRHRGYAIVHNRAGRADHYDLRDRRISWARVSALSEGYRVDLFGHLGQATGYAIVHVGEGRVEFFDTNSHPVGSGWLDKTGHVTTFDLSGRRRTDTALPVQRWRPAQGELPSD